MHAYFALALAFAAPALLVTRAARLGYEREILTSSYNQVPKLQEYVLNDQYLAQQKNRAKLLTKPRPDEPLAADDVILESNIVKIVRPAKRRADLQEGELVRQRRGYNLENVNVPARYPYLAVPSYYRYRRWG